jgi:hypothetical protein
MICFSWWSEKSTVVEEFMYLCSCFIAPWVLLVFVLQVPKGLVFNAGDSDNAVTDSDEEVCALSVSYAFCGRVEFVKSNLQSFW